MYIRLKHSYMLILQLHITLHSLPRQIRNDNFQKRNEIKMLQGIIELNRVLCMLISKRERSYLLDRFNALLFTF